MTGLILVGLVPFAALGILAGHLLSEDTMGPAVGGITAILAFVSGTWFPLPAHGFLHGLVAEPARPPTSCRRDVSASAATPGGRRGGWWWPPGRSCSGSWPARAYLRDTARA